MQTVALTVSDNVPPVPVCEDEINLSLTPDDINFEDGGIAKIFAENLNIGSHDSGCGEVWFKLVRQEELFDAPNGFWNDSGENGAPDYNQPPRGKFFPPYACDGANTDDFPDVIRFDEKGDLEFIPTFDQVFFDDDAKFCCDDVGTEIMVVLRVFDVDPGEGSVDPRRMIGYESGIENFDAITPDLFGHFNDCLVKVNVELKLAPIVNCPDDVTVNCLDNTSVDDLGMGSVVNLCGSIDIGYVDANNTIDPSCGNGVIARSWFADYDGDGVVSSVAEQQHQCIQYITVDASSTFKPWTIKFPMNVAGESALGYTRECTENGYVTLAGDVFGITSQEENVITEQRGYECTDVPEQCIPEWDSGSCGLVGYTLDVDTFYFEKDACMKIFGQLLTGVLGCLILEMTLILMMLVI